MLKHATSHSYTSVLLAIFVAVFYTDVSGYAYTSGLLPVPPRYTMLVLGVLTLPILWKHLRQGKVRLNDRFVVFVLVAVSIVSIGFVVHLSTESLSFFAVELTGLLFLLLCYVLFRDEDASRVARRAVLVCLVLAIVINLFELVFPGTFSNTPGRSAGLYINPNSSAYALVAGLILTIGVLPPRLRVALLVATGAAVLSTMSRAGILVFGAVALVLWWRGDLVLGWRRTPVLVNTLIVVAFVGFFAGAYATVSEFREAIRARAEATTELAEAPVAPAPPEEVPTREEAREARQAERDAKKAESRARAKEERAARQEEKESGLRTSTRKQREALEEKQREAELQAEKNRRNEERSERKKARGLEKLDERREGINRRATLTADAVSAYLQAPLLGIGATQAWELKPHNTYLSYGLAYGLIGWAFIPAFAAAIFLGGDRRVTVPMVVFVLLVALFTHNLMMDRALLLPLALAAALRPPSEP